MKSELSETLTKKQTHTQQNLRRQYGTRTRSAFSKQGCGNERWQNLFRHGARGGRGGTSYWSPLSFSAIDPAWPWPSQDGSILQQRGARQQVQGMSWGRTKRKGGREKKKWERKQNKNKGQRLVMIGGGGGWEKARERTIANSPDTQTCAKHVCTCADIQKLFAVTLAALSELKRTDTRFTAKPGPTRSPALKK